MFSSKITETLRRFLTTQGWLRIAGDPTQKLARDLCISDEYLQRTVGNGDKTQTRWYVYLLEASVVLGGAIALPVMT